MALNRILISTGIFTPDIGGPASYAHMLATALSTEHKVTVVTYSKPRTWPQDRAYTFRVVRVWKSIPRFLRHGWYLWKMFRETGKHDLIFSLNAVGAGVPALLAAKWHKKKFFVKIVGDRAWEEAVNTKKTALLIGDFQDSRPGGWIEFLHRCQVWVCRNASLIIVPSEYLSELVQGWGVPQERIRVIYNGTNFHTVDISKEEARKKIAIPGNIILSVGRLVMWKGFRMLVKIMPQLLNVNQFFRLVIVGEGPERVVLEQMIHNMGLERKVILAGKKNHEELTLYFAAADLFVLNTGYEGFSHQLLEAFSAGVSVITTAVGGNREVVRQGENGFLVKYNDEFNLVEAIKTLWEMPDLREQFTAEGKKTAEYFSVERMIDRTVAVLKS